MNREIVSVQPLGGTRLLVEFAGGDRREVDIARIAQPSGVFERLLDPTFFNAVQVNAELGTIIWPNGADLCPDVIYDASWQVTKPNAA